MRSDNHELSSTRILMLGIICCIVVANIYFNQSVLNLIAGSFPNEWGAVSLIPMVTQVGYAVGLFFLIPLAIILNVSGLSCVKRRCFSWQ